MFSSMLHLLLCNYSQHKRVAKTGKEVVYLFAFGNVAYLENGERKCTECEYVQMAIALHACTHVRCVQEHALMHCAHVCITLSEDLCSFLCIVVVTADVPVLH